METIQANKNKTAVDTIKEIKTSETKEQLEARKELMLAQLKKIQDKLDLLK